MTGASHTGQDGAAARSAHLDGATSAAFFDRRYRAHPDPWGFATRRSEADRYAALLALVAGCRFRRAFEPGCSIGVFTALLAPSCERLVATDLSPVAVDAARIRCAGLPHVAIGTGCLPADMPDGTFDLVAFNELGYYFAEVELAAVLDRLVDRIEPGGVVIGSHWTGRSPDHRISGEAVHRALDRCPGLQRRAGRTLPDHLAGLWERR